MHDQADPRLFIAANLAVCAALVVHAGRRYGIARARPLVLALVVVATWKELAIRPLPYEVLLTTARPFGVPVGVIGGWLITALLAMEWSRRSAALLPRPLRERSGPRALLLGFFASCMAQAVEPIGQAAGWWRWHLHHPGGPPVLAREDWAVNVVIMSVTAFLFAPRAARLSGWRLALAALSLGAGLTAFSTVMLAKQGAVPSTILGPLVVGLPLLLLVAPGFRLDAGWSRPGDGGEMQPWEHALPLVTVSVIVVTLAHYARLTGQPQLALYSWPLVLASALVFGLGSLRELRAASVPASPKSRLAGAHPATTSLSSR